jgi:hypothetical protein
MSYLERNSRLIAEVGANLTLKRGTNGGEGTFICFNSVGAYPSKEINSDLYVGVKEPKGSFNSKDLSRRFVFELAVMSVVAENMPHLLPELPLFYGLLTDSKGMPMAIVTEDFSKDGQNYVEPYRVEPEGLLDLFVPGTIYEDDYDGSLLSIAFKISPKGSSGNEYHIRLGDFYPLFIPCTSNELLRIQKAHRERFPEEQIEQELGKHTLKIAYDLQ